MNPNKPALIFIFYCFSALLRLAGALLPFFPMGFSPMESLSLFSTRLISYRWLAYLFPLMIIMSTDTVINYFFSQPLSPFYPGFYWQYLAYFLLTLLGQFFNNLLTLKRVLLSSILGASLFFLISNFGVWVSSSLYPPTGEGLITCYLMALPFYGKNILATLFFSCLIYATFQKGSLKISLRELQT